MDEFDRPTYDRPWSCSVKGCPRQTAMQTNEERRFGISLCDDEQYVSHYMQFVDAQDESWEAAKRWVETYC